MSNSKETKEQKRKNKESRKEFEKKIDRLFMMEYRYSTTFEKRHIKEDGKAYINIDLTKCEDGPFSIYSYGDRVDQEIYDYIDQEVFYLPADVQVVLNFDDGGKYSNELKERIAKAVVRHYALDYEDKRKELEKNNKIAFFTILAGIVLLSIYVVLSIILQDFAFNTLFIEIVLIISWMLIWTSVERFIYTGGAKRIEVYNAGQLALVEVQFGDPIK